jgi:hypothetical protein
MKIKLDRLISVATLGTSVVALMLVLKRPAPVAAPLPPPAVAANAQSFEQKMQQLDAARAQGQSGAEVRLNAQEVAAAIAQASGALSSGASSGGTTPEDSSGASSGGSGSPLSGDLGPGEASVKDYQVNFEGDVAKGQFLTHIAGKDVWVTLEGRLGSKDGYATFDPTKIKIGDLEVPVSLVNDQLQKRLAEQRDRLKLPDGLGGIKVENGEVVLTNK